MTTWSIKNLSLAAIAILLPVLGGLAVLAWQQDHGGGPAPHYAHLSLLLAGVVAALLTKVYILYLLQRRSGKLLAHSERRYRQIVETALEGIWLADADGRIRYANVRSAEMVGYLPAELLGRHVNDFIDAPPGHIRCDIYEHPEQDIRQLRDLRYRTRDGLPGWALVRSQTLRDDDGRFAGALVMVSDITARKLGEQALAQAHAELELRIAERTAELETAVARLRAEIAVRRAAEQARANSDSRLHEIISMMPLSLFIKDGDSRIILMNEACEDSWGVRFDSVFGQRSSGELPPEQLAEFLANDRAAFARRELVVSEETVWNVRRHQGRGPAPHCARHPRRTGTKPDGAEDRRQPAARAHPRRPSAPARAHRRRARHAGRDHRFGARHHQRAASHGAGAGPARGRRMADAADRAAQRPALPARRHRRQCRSAARCTPDGRHLPRRATGLEQCAGLRRRDDGAAVAESAPAAADHRRQRRWRRPRERRAAACGGVQPQRRQGARGGHGRRAGRRAPPGRRRHAVYHAARRGRTAPAGAAVRCLSRAPDPAPAHIRVAGLGWMGYHHPRHLHRSGEF